MLYCGQHSNCYPPKVYITEEFLSNLSPERVNLKIEQEERDIEGGRESDFRRINSYPASGEVLFSFC